MWGVRGEGVAPPKRNIDLLLLPRFFCPQPSDPPPLPTLLWSSGSEPDCHSFYSPNHVSSPLLLEVGPLMLTSIWPELTYISTWLSVSQTAFVQLAIYTCAVPCKPPTPPPEPNPGSQEHETWSTGDGVRGKGLFNECSRVCIHVRESATCGIVEWDWKKQNGQKNLRYERESACFLSSERCRLPSFHGPEDSQRPTS